MCVIRKVLALAFGTQTLASVISKRGQVAVAGNVCTVTAGNGVDDDVPAIVQAFEQCGQGGTIVFPEGNTYNIATVLNPVVKNVTIQWQGTWLYSTDLDYWRNNSYPIAFQNHRAGFTLSGDGITIDGYGTGGIDGNGDTWYVLTEDFMSILS